MAEPAAEHPWTDLLYWAKVFFTNMDRAFAEQGLNTWTVLITYIIVVASICATIMYFGNRYFDAKLEKLKAMKRQHDEAAEKARAKAEEDKRQQDEEKKKRTEEMCQGSFGNYYIKKKQQATADEAGATGVRPEEGDCNREG